MNQEDEKILNKYTYVDWNSLLMKENLSKEFIKRNIKNIPNEKIKYLLASQEVSEDILEKNINLFEYNSADDRNFTANCWNLISQCQKLSEKFIMKHFNKINIRSIFLNKKISQEIKDNIKKEILLLKEII